MTTVLDYNEIKEELIVFLRNQDIFTTTERSVTTDTDTGTFSSASSHLIAVSNVKNIRSIVVASVTKSFGTDYTVDYDFNDSGTIKTKITFTSAQTGAYTITYDYGTDIMFPNFPRVDLNVSSFPRLGLEIIGDNSNDADLPGEIEDTTITFTVVAYDKSNKEIETTLKAIRTAFITNKKGFYYLRYVKRLATGPLGYFGDPKNNIKMKNMDFLCPNNIELI